MDEGMIWNTYFKHRRQELRERFPQCRRRRGTCTKKLTYLQIRTDLGDELHNYILSENKEYLPIELYDFVSHYFVEKICFEFLDDDLTTYVINCYCRKQRCPNPVVEIPRLNFWFNINHWWPSEVRDFIETLPQFFVKWKEEMWTLNHEIPKIRKKWEMRKIRSELLGQRKIKSHVWSRYKSVGLCLMYNEKVCVQVPLSDGHGLGIETKFVYYYADWVERTVEVVDALVDYFECQIEKNGCEWMPDKADVECEDGKEWTKYSGDWEIPEDLKALTASKKRWLKLMPLEVEIY